MLLVNDRHIKNIPCKKTDTEDIKRLSGLLYKGLMKAGFILLKEVRQWRGLTQLRINYTQSLGDYKRHTNKL